MLSLAIMGNRMTSIDHPIHYGLVKRFCDEFAASDSEVQASGMAWNRFGDSPVSPYWASCDAIQEALS